ncbi:16S rRNA (uracil(1498)-N(3))-methyltransferase [Simiduia sp. 21SJ11W-1]|uniref:16S rRNA (uracil(1498)-N(3))-methyltransferase n=1 Tax=Simiduia sp. 21SJ11W-1 TaxID=2909669 RepID=UPI00209EA950|nr:16S rRNA (uracil(1498)-N(3))-methyltransferase [Simiduia sp. 21SJ11W-1]UTA49431.1 16S rRNA (uracil(1498)-N(3))-methyltransferase [Simiduia sp. 21SJ11W-1]
MNLLLLDTEDFTGSDQAVLTGRRAKHLFEVHKAQAGDQLRVGLIDGCMGQAIVTHASETRATLEAIALTEQPPAPLPVSLLLSLPRPKMLRRILQTASAMGVKHITLINGARVEKSFWQTPFLQPQAIREQLVLGLEQAKDTRLPTVEFAKRFKPFVEDELAGRVTGCQNYVAHPYQATPCPTGVTRAKHCHLAVGPEGGYVEFEVKKLQEIGFQAISLGPRILRVETALPVLLSKLF